MGHCACGWPQRGIVTSRRANLHNEIVKLLGQADKYLIATSVQLYAVAYRPVRRTDNPEIDLWQETLALGQPLPTLPLALTGELCVPVNLDSTYEDVCRRRLGES
ncbi:MAG: hypothetical protein HY040_06425 [Planctomycetes bacterium]|nr:hypothetical protein [Planctomycetota bacterium]